MEYRLSGRAEDYRLRIPEVGRLFSTVFERAFPADAWDQWYLSNPYGDPYVALAYHADQLVGHHALIPQKLVNASGGSLRYFLSVSTMVHPHHRKLGGFLHMVEMLHEAVRDSGAACVLAFPNSRSAPLFETLCGYTPIVQTELCNWKPQSVPAASHPETDTSRVAGTGRTAEYSYPTDSAYWDWRTRSNHAKSCTVDGRLHLVYKVIEPATLMLLDARVEEERNAPERLAHLANGLGLSEIRLTRHHANLLGIPNENLTPHEGYIVRFFGFPLAEEIPAIRLSLLFSDVF